MRSGEVIVLRDVWFRYLPEQDYVLKGIDVEVHEAELVAIVGPNGSGKTTLAKVMMGLVRPSKGIVRIFGRDIKEWSWSELAKSIGYVPQNPKHIFCNVTVRDELKSTLESLGMKVSDEVIAKLLEVVGLETYFDKNPFRLSWGEQKRLAIAMAIARNPKLLIIDEPTIGLDYCCKEQIASILNGLKSSIGSIIVITHDVDFLTLLDVDRIYLMNAGQIVLSGRPEDVMYLPSEVLEKYGLVKPQIVEVVEKVNAVIGLKGRPFRFEDVARYLRYVLELRKSKFSV